MRNASGESGCLAGRLPGAAVTLDRSAGAVEDGGHEPLALHRQFIELLRLRRMLLAREMPRQSIVYKSMHRTHPSVLHSLFGRPIIWNLPNSSEEATQMERFWPRLFSRFARTERQKTGDEFPPLYPRGNEDVETTAYYIRSRRFGRRLFGGLEPEEVATFLDEVAEALHTAQREQIETAAQVRLLEDEVLALTVKNKEAPSDAFQGAERQASPIIRQDDQNDEARAASRLEVLRSTALQEVEALLHDAQVRAQALTEAAHERAATILREADALKSQRQKEAEQLVAEATVTAESILMTARDQEASLRHELDRLAESRLRMLDDVWATLNGCHEWLATVDPRRQRSQEREGRIDRVA
jgi:DivIVA domain-containing protein